MFAKHLFIVCALLEGLVLAAQPPSLNFRHLTTTEGLSDDIVRSMAQDKYGYMWFGTIDGLTIYNGSSCKVIDAGEILSSNLRLPSITALCRDSNGAMWVGTMSGLFRYDYASTKFISQPGTSNFRIARILAGNDGLLYLQANGGLQVYNPAAQRVEKSFVDTVTQRLLSQGIHDLCSWRNGTICLAADTGILVYQPSQRKAVLLKTNSPLSNLSQIATDAAGSLWCSSSATLYFVKEETVKTFLLAKNNTQVKNEDAINDLLVDNQNRLWITTSRTGLGLYNAASDSFVFFRHDALQLQSLSSNIASTLFQGSDGTLWIGTEGYGLNYVHPDQNAFSILVPSAMAPSLPDVWCRAASEDRKGRWWIATANGAAMYHPATNSYAVFQNQPNGKKVLYTNSVRALLCASDGTVWLGTSEGLNRYHPESGTMDFLGEKEGLPTSFFWHLAEDNQQRTWAACRNGIYTYNSVTRRFDDNANGPLQSISRLRCRTIFVDKENRFWFGFDGDGLACYDAKTGRLKQWRKKEGEAASLSNDYVTSVAEDKSGTIWISTFSGLNKYIPKTDNFQHYSTADGLPSNRLSSLLADDENRLWMGSSKGLCMMDKTRQHVQNFSEEDGLLAASFNDQSGCRLANGMFLMPTLKGLLYFHPSLYRKQNTTAPVYLSAFRVNNRPFSLSTNPEDADTIRLHWDESFFSFTVASPNYRQRNRETFGYWLEGFDKGWVYSKDATRNYTNVPGGDYVLHLKATGDAENWQVPETKIAVHVGTVFYKTWWFALLSGLLLLGLVYTAYRYRLWQQQRLLSLQAKATALEKEKTLALYESLKQQLNPHFLFNSLSSLSGLIRKDPAKAGVFLDQLSKIYRYILKSRDTETVRVSEDLKLAQSYLQLQQTRFGSGLQLQVDLDEDALAKKIAPVTVQNLLENAIKHNIIADEEPLLISVSSGNNFLVVRNNLQKKSFVESSNKQGLQNLKTLYRYLSGRSIEIEETATTFTVKIPFV